MYSHSRRKTRAARWSLISNLTLLVLKTGVLLFTNSIGILAEVVNSAGDLVGSAVAYFSVRVSDAPPDKEHPYGHGRIENLSGLATSLLILFGGAYALYRELHTLVYGSRIMNVNLALGVMALSIVINICVSRHLTREGKATDSPALCAEGMHLRTDVLTSVGVLVGIALVRMTGMRFFDPLAGLLVTLLTLKLGYTLIRNSLKILSDQSLPAEEESILAGVLAQHPAVMHYHELRTRKAGSHRYIDVHILVEDSTSFVESHRLSEEIEEQLRSVLPNVHPTLHMEPYEEEMERIRKQ